MKIFKLNLTNLKQNFCKNSSLIFFFLPIEVNVSFLTELYKRNWWLPNDNPMSEKYNFNRVYMCTHTIFFYFYCFIFGVLSFLNFGFSGFCFFRDSLFLGILYFRDSGFFWILDFGFSVFKISGLCPSQNCFSWNWSSLIMIFAVYFVLISVSDFVRVGDRFAFDSCRML